METKDEFTEIRDEWQEFYLQYFDQSVNFSLVIIPQKPEEDKWRLLFIPKGMTMNRAYLIASKLFSSLKYRDLDTEYTKNIRDNNKHYAVWVRDSVEPDEEFLGKSSFETDLEMKIGITLLERIIFEVKYFSETGNHLDIKGKTFCSGSRNADYGVLFVPNTTFSLYWDNQFIVNFEGPSFSYPNYGIRRIVSL